MWQHFADILASEADDNGVEAELVDLGDCEPDDDLIISVVDFLAVFLCWFILYFNFCVYTFCRLIMSDFALLTLCLRHIDR